MSDPVYESSLSKLKEKIGDLVINAETIVQVLKFAMEVVEVTELKGSAQKELAIKLVRVVVVEAPISDEKEKLLLDMIDNNILSNTVDLVIAATQGKLDINTVVEVGQACCQTGCMGLFKKKN